MIKFSTLAGAVFLSTGALAAPAASLPTYVYAGTSDAAEPARTIQGQDRAMSKLPSFIYAGQDRVVVETGALTKTAARAALDSRSRQLTYAFIG